MQSQPKVAVLMGSENDAPHLEGCLELLRRFGIACEVRVMSAHRAPELVDAFAAGAAAEGCEVIIAAAGLAAALPGVVAARTLLPVIGVPIPSATAFAGLDALLSTVQMPGGIPVATVTVGKAGGVNAAVLAARILALKYPAVAQALALHRESLKQ